MRKRRLSAALALILALSMSFSSFAEEMNAADDEAVVVQEESSEEKVITEESSDGTDDAVDSDSDSDSDASGTDSDSGSSDAGSTDGDTTGGTTGESVDSESTDTYGTGTDEGTGDGEEGSDADTTATGETAAEGSGEGATGEETGTEGSGEEAAAEEEAVTDGNTEEETVAEGASEGEEAVSETEEEAGEESSHTFEAAWIWAEDYSAAEVTLTCTDEDCDESVTLEADISSETIEATEEEDGSITYTAVAVYQEVEYTDVVVVVLEYEGDAEETDTADAADLYEAVSGKTYAIEGEDGSVAAEVTLTWNGGTFSTEPNAVRIVYVTDTSSVEKFVKESYEEEGLSATILDAVGVDITFYAFDTDEDGNAVPAYDEDGNLDEAYSVQPAEGETVTVSITFPADAALEAGANDGTQAEVVIVHEADDGTITELNEEDVDTTIEATEEAVTAVAFEAESFSTYYTVTYTVSDDTSYTYSIEVDESTKTITVSQTGDSAGYEIQAAINYIAKNYATGDYVGDWTIVVNEGTYCRFFISEKYSTALEGLTVTAADGAEVVINVFDDSATPTGVNGETLTYSSTPDVGGVYVNVTGVTLSGLTFQYGTSTGYTQWYASAISTFNNQAGCEVYELTISNCNFYGQGDRYGFMVCDVKVWTIEGCTFSNLAVGISFMEDNSAIQATIKGNTFMNCSDAILESYAGGTPTEGVSYYLTVTGNTILGTASNYTTVCIMNEYKNVDSLGTVTIEGNTFEYVTILLDCIDITADKIYEANTIGEGVSVIITSFGHDPSAITDADKVVTFTASSSSGYWVLTSAEGISTADLAYIQNLITTANANGSTTLTIDMNKLDLTGSSLNGYLSGGVKYLKTVLNWVTTTSVTVTKKWDDEDDKDKLRPDSVTVELYQNGKATGQTATLSADNDWTYTFDEWSDDYRGLPVHDADGTTDYSYSVVENSVKNYSTDYSVTGSNEEGWSWTVTNIHKVVKTSVTVSKVWDDSDDEDELRPSSVTIELCEGGEATGQTVTLSENNGWSASFDDLPAYSYDEDGNAAAIAYTVVETEVDDYEASYSVSGDIEDGYSVTVTNTYEPKETTTTTTTTSAATGALGIIKVDAATGARLAGATFALYNDTTGTLIGYYTTDSNGYLQTSQLTLNYTYSFMEVTAPAGYILDSTAHSVTLTSNLSSSSSSPYVLTISNTAESSVLEADRETGAEIIEAETEEAGEVLGTERGAGTGDTSNLLLWILLLIAAGAGLGAAVIYFRFIPRSRRRF